MTILDQWSNIVQWMISTGTIVTLKSISVEIRRFDFRSATVIDDGTFRWYASSGRRFALKTFQGFLDSSIRSTILKEWKSNDRHAERSSYLWFITMRVHRVHVQRNILHDTTVGNRCQFDHGMQRNVRIGKIFLKNVWESVATEKRHADTREHSRNLPASLSRK